MPGEGDKGFRLEVVVRMQRCADEYERGKAGVELDDGAKWMLGNGCT